MHTAPMGGNKGRPARHAHAPPDRLDDLHGRPTHMHEARPGQPADADRPRPTDVKHPRAGAAEHPRARNDKRPRPEDRARQPPGDGKRRAPPGRPYHVGRQERGTRRWWPIVTVFAALAVGVSLLIPAGRHQWALSLIRQPTRYTTLSFNKAWALPATAAFNEPIRISFTISNQEGRSLDYQYVLTQSDGRVSQTLGKSARMVAAGGTWTVTAVIRPTCAASSCRVEVSLPGHPEKIGFFVALSRP